MKIQPYQYQIKAVQHALKNKEVALFLDLGLGKTVVCLTAIKNLIKQKKIKSALILAPLRVVYNVWPAEIKKWDHLKDLSHVILHGKDKNTHLQKDVDIYLMNYEGIKWLANQMRGIPRDKSPFDLIIYDESTAVKAHNTKRFRYLRNLQRLFSRRFILTGTPAPNSLLDLWSQYYLLDGGRRLGTSWYAYRNRYFYQSDYMGYNWDPRPGTSKEISSKVKDITLRLRSADYLDLPEKIFNEINCTLPDIHREKYDQLERDFLLEIENETVTAFNAAALSNKLRQFVGGIVYNENGNSLPCHNVKLDALEEIKDNYPSEPLLIAIQFRAEYQLLKQRFKKLPVIYGGVGPKHSSLLIDQWCKGQLPLLVVHPQSIAHGVNLQTGGRNLIWYSLPWSFEQYHQMIGRLYRQGQTKPVIIHHLLLERTIDQHVLRTLQQKEKTEKNFLQFFLKKMKKN